VDDDKLHAWIYYSLKKALDQMLEKGPKVDIMDALTQASFIMMDHFTISHEDKMKEHGIKRDCKILPYIEHKLTKDVILHAKQEFQKLGISKISKDSEDGRNKEHEITT